VLTGFCFLGFAWFALILPHFAPFASEQLVLDICNKRSLLDISFFKQLPNQKIC
jgi:hypothetical protein